MSKHKKTAEKIGEIPKIVASIKKKMPKKDEVDSLSKEIFTQTEKKPAKQPKQTIKEQFPTRPISPKIVKNNVQTQTPVEHEGYFVYLKNPLDYRRHVLESSKDVLMCLKGYQKIVLIRQKKLEEIQKLKASIKELIYLNKKFNDMLPKYNNALLDGMKVEKQEAPKPAVLPKFKTVPQKKEMTEIDRLEESLAKLEEKLRELK